MKQQATAFQALSHPLRLRILKFLGDNGETRVNDIHDGLGEEKPPSQSCLSQHLAVLRKAGLVETCRESQRIYYSVSEDGLLSVQEAVKSITASA